MCAFVCKRGLFLLLLAGWCLYIHYVYACMQMNIVHMHEGSKPRMWITATTTAQVLTNYVACTQRHGCLYPQDELSRRHNNKRDPDFIKASRAAHEISARYRDLDVVDYLDVVRGVGNGHEEGALLQSLASALCGDGRDRRRGLVHDVPIDCTVWATCESDRYAPSRLK
jgi:hypothetical protein